MSIKQFAERVRSEPLQRVKVEHGMKIRCASWGRIKNWMYSAKSNS